MLIGRQKIIIGDCLTVLQDMAAASIDVVVTSPPYNLGIDYRSYDDRRPREVYLQWMADVAAALARVIKPNGSIFLNVGSTNCDPWVMHDVAAAFRAHLMLQNHITWIKSISIGDDSIGHFKPIRSKRFLNQNHEAIFHFTQTGDVAIDRLAVGVPFKHKGNIARRGHAQDKRCAGNCWFIPYETVQSRSQKFHHPASFPLELARRCIQLHGGGVVLDPFLGSGTTLVAAERLGCAGIGIELDQDYASTAAKRLRDEVEPLSLGG